MLEDSASRTHYFIYTSREAQRDLKSQRGGMAMQKAAAMKGPCLIDSVPLQAKDSTGSEVM